ncbi:MAG: pyridoxine 5'-phosphate synthase [Methylacidiphilales bacterium]|nr:pyridoxine 5'-phosphate synthase [Candidatus Methylacidiphilales bacterium]MDW8348931.1 pyridoxine 5'-phosphate synthase [Verrucomicrobiae bacterium]
MAYLGVNLDHVATLRQARYRGYHTEDFAEPSPRHAAKICLLAGVPRITLHLREDRRHIQDSDVLEISRLSGVILNLEMAPTEEMVRIASKIRPAEVCLVPERRQELTTEGGLNVPKQASQLEKVIRTLTSKKIRVSLFVDPIIQHIEIAKKIGAHVIELHTGAYANGKRKADRQRELKRHVAAAQKARELQLQINAGHGLDYDNIVDYAQAIPDVHTFNIGHAIVSRAMWTGLKRAVEEMLALLPKNSSPEYSENKKIL